MSSSVTNMLSSALFPALYLLIALGFEMGIKYRVQPMYSATHLSSTRPPRYRIRFAGRHVWLIISVCSAAYINQQRPITEITTGMVVWIALTAVYVALIIRDAFGEMKSS